MPKLPQQELANGNTSYRRLFETFGLTFSANGSAQATADACPFCDGPKFTVNLETGQYQCFRKNNCGVKGNAYVFVNAMHENRLRETTDADYRRLRDLRGLPLQTLKRHSLAWDATQRCWWIPYKSQEGKVQNITRYYEGDGRKLTLPSLPLRLHGLDRLSSDVHKTLLICEGAFDSIALDAHLVSNKTRKRYDILAVPSAGVFKTDWLKHLEGRTVRLLFDNDEAGRDGQDRIAKLCRDENLKCKLSILRWPEGLPEKCDVSDLIRDGVNIVEFAREHCLKVTTAERRLVFTRGDDIVVEKVEWMDFGYIQFGTLASLSGLMGTLKSTVAADYAARGTAGLPMPGSRQAIAPFNTMYFTSEDSASRVSDSVRVHGGDLNRLYVHDIASSKEPIDLLDCLEEMEAEINARQIRLVILDALNSFTGGDISTDSKARRTLSGRLQALGRKTGACIIGIRNWGRMDGGTAFFFSIGTHAIYAKA